MLSIDLTWSKHDEPEEIEFTRSHFRQILAFLQKKCSDEAKRGWWGYSGSEDDHRLAHVIQGRGLWNMCREEVDLVNATGGRWGGWPPSCWGKWSLGDMWECVVETSFPSPPSSSVPHYSLCFPVNCSSWANLKEETVCVPKETQAEESTGARMFQKTTGYVSTHLGTWLGCTFISNPSKALLLPRECVRHIGQWVPGGHSNHNPNVIGFSELGQEVKFHYKLHFKWVKEFNNKDMRMHITLQRASNWCFLP